MQSNLEPLLKQLIEGQRERVLALATRILPHVTTDDILQPNDFPQLEQNASFRYEEGILAGMLAAQMALLAELRG